MDRDKKNEVISGLADSFSRAKIAVIAEYRGLKVAHIQVAKNTLLRIAVKDTPYDNLKDSFTGTTAVAVGYTEPVGPAKVLTAFAKDFSASFSIRSVGLDGNILDASALVALSKLPGREELLAQLLGTMAAVPTGFVRVLSAVPKKLLYALIAVKEQKENQ